MEVKVQVRMLFTRWSRSVPRGNHNTYYLSEFQTKKSEQFRNVAKFLSDSSHCFSLFSLYFQFWRLFQKSLCTMCGKSPSSGACPSQIAILLSLGLEFLMKWKPTYIYGDLNFSDSRQVFANLFSWRKLEGSLIISWKFQGRTPQEIWITAIFPARNKVVSYNVLHHTALQHAEGRRDVRRCFFNFLNSLPFVLPKEEVKRWRCRTPVGWDTDSVWIWLLGAPKKRRSTGSKGPSGPSLSRDSCSGRHQTGMKPGEWAAFPKRQPALLAARRERDEPLYEETIVPEEQETKSERAANRRAGERVVSLEVEVGDFGVINHRKDFLFVKGTHGS